MNTVKLRLEYKCFPMWIYDEQGNLIDNDIVEEISNDNEIVNLLDNIQEEFDELYVDDGIEFGFKGFQNEQSRASFREKVEQAYTKIQTELSNNYTVINLIDVRSM